MVLHRKRQAERKWASLLEHKAAHPAVSLRWLAAQHGVCARALQTRWRRFLSATAAGDPNASITASKNNRGGHNRTFSAAEEVVLSQQIKAAVPAMTQHQIRGAALSLHRSKRIADGGRALSLRRHESFHASDGFVSAFKRRNRLSSHTMKATKAVPERSRAQREDDVILFVHDAREAVQKYGARMVLNMDETPVPKCEHPRTGVTSTGSKFAAPCSTTAGNRLNVTCFCCISAAGDKLQQSAVLRGKTQRVVQNIMRDAPAAVSRVRFYYSQTGWINSSIVVRWLHDVVQPYTHSRPAALLLDDYNAHWTDAVKDAAAAMNLQLIKVPPCQTVEYQPLDVCYHGPMTKARARLWTEQRTLMPDAADTFQAAVERSQLAYDSMSRQAGVDAFRKSYIVD